MQRKILAMAVFSISGSIQPGAINLPKLQEEFSRVGIYKPNNPEQYNEARANEILQSIQSNRAYRKIADNLRRQQLESLTKQSTISNEQELNRLKEENQQLRAHAQHLKEKNVHLRKKSKNLIMPLSRSSSSNDEETEQLREEITILKEEVARLKNAQGAKAEDINPLEKFQTLASKTITNLNEFERLILSAGYDLDRNYPEGALQFIRAAREQLSKIKESRDDLSTVFE